MKRTIATFKVEENINLKQQMLSWGNQFNICCLLDNNNYKSTNHSFELLLAVGSKKIFTTTSNSNELNDLKTFLTNNNDWLFGHISYDFKNHIYPILSSNKIDNIQLPDVFLFQPEIVIKLTSNILTIESLTTEPTIIYNTISAIKIDEYNIEIGRASCRERVLNLV